MRKLSAILLRLLTLALAPLLSGCFDIHEEYWLARDGSARAEFRYTVPSQALLLSDPARLEQDIREAVATQPSLRLDAVQVTPAGDGVHIALNLSTDSIFDLVDVVKTARAGNFPASAADLAGRFEVHMKGLEVDFARTVKVSDALGLASIGIGRKDKELRRLSYIVHLPVVPKESNADRTEDGGRTLIWESTLGEAMKAPLVTRFRAPVPLQPQWIAAAAGGVLLLGLLVCLLWRRLRRKRLA